MYLLPRVFSLLNDVVFVDGQDHGYGGVIDSDYFLDLVLPFGRGLDRALISDVANQDCPRSIAAEGPVDACEGGVHADQVPNLEADFVSLNVEDLYLEVGCDRGLVVVVEAVANKSVHDGGLAHSRIANNYDLKHL